MNNLNFKKPFLRLILFALISGLSAACTDLEPELYSDLTTKNAYNSESDIEAALTGTYASLNPYPGDAYLYYAGYLMMLTDYNTDIGFSTAAGDPTKHSNFTYDDNSRYLRLNWQNMYKVISNANMLLSKISGIEIEEDKKNEIIAQARFLRALSYRDLTDSWGAVPLITEPDNPTESDNVPLSSVSEVDAQIIEDCEFAISHLPEKWAPELGISRATKGAALTLLGKVYMRNHNYEKAKEYIDEVLDLRAKGVYSLNPDFKDEWSGDNKIDMGLIFGILHEAAQNGGEITNHFGPQDHPEIENRWQYYAVSLPFWRKYSEMDPRKEFYYYNYEGASPRDPNTSHGFYYMMPDIGQTVPPSDTVKLLRNVATKKYSYEMISDSYLDGRTIQIFRLADVILAKAEIENELNGPSAALPYINEIRTRAGAPAYGESGFSIPTTKDEMVDALVNERGYELVFEYKRKADLIRLGKYVEVSNEYLKKRGMQPIVTDNLKYFPYPLEEARNHKEMSAENSSRIP
ncbi:Starch-binding associating with outer membrane [Salegentibacter echinorum]|uniref:Starch-binding associating with outer membrane n=1 Tax=Salegentibacter echinorum TaxID=1073325 RepID=A0A1M5IDX3_SALEC|nr:RagB/SusD family nutrient uptake outer membrane protein [Salegentibacter echinorum]SHG26455.1 Starch-binding associating with outer membrane [Salegentibacter echinorum]